MRRDRVRGEHILFVVGEGAWLSYSTEKSHGLLITTHERDVVLKCFVHTSLKHRRICVL